MNTYAITKDNLPSFAYTNEKIVSLPIRSVVLDFHGLNMNQMLSEPSERSVFYAQNGVLHVIPYDNPWSWMNDTAVQMTDCIVDAVYARLGLSPAVPLISTGGSMGGLSALSYTVRTRHKVAACAANCPVCDLVFHYTERPDLPRTILSAFWGEDAAEQILRVSPLHRVDDFPDIPYYIVHGEADQAVNLQKHSLPLVNAMQKRGLNVTFDRVPNMQHCALEGDALCRYYDFVLSVR